MRAKRSLSPEDYLALERQLEWKNEYIDGEMVAMTGVSRGGGVGAVRGDSGRASGGGVGRVGS